MSSGVAVSVLGGIEARRASGVVSVPGTKLQALLALLAVSVPHPVSDGRLIAEVWGDDRLANPNNSLQAQIVNLRRILGREVVVRRGAGYALVIDPDDVDALRFERLVDRSRQLAREGDQRSAAQGFQAAISLVRGPPLGDLADFGFARDVAARLDELLLAAHEGLAEAGLAQGRHADLVVPLETLVGEHPFRERFHAQLIRALYRCGRQSDALRAYGRARDLLVEELGVEPGPELRDLELAVLSHDPALAAPTEQVERSRSPASRLAPDGVLRFVGRNHELVRLLADLDDALDGRVRIALLAGEAGIGKTRLAEQLCREAVGRGMGIARGRCYRGRGAPAMLPWTQVVGSLVLDTDADVVIRALGRGAADLGRMVPDVHDLVPEVALTPPADPESERFRFCESLTRFLQRLAETRPLLVVLEDLHWADAPSLEALSFLAGTVLDARLLVVATYRNVGAPTSGPLAETVADLAGQPAVRCVDLFGLDRAAVREMLEAAGVQHDEELLRALHRRTQGNPFFVVETLKLRSAEGLVDVSSIPSGAREVIRQRIGRLPEPTLDAIDAASVVGSEFDAVVLAETLAADVARILRDLEPAFAAGLLTEDPRSPGRCQFSHGLVRDTVYDDLGAAGRPDLHRRVAEALETVHGEPDGMHLLALADHWFHAVPAAPPDKAVAAALRASRWAQRNMARQQAGEHLQAALAVLVGMPEGQRRSELDLEVRSELNALLITSSGHARPQVDQACARMRELCSSIDDLTLRVPALWRLATFHMIGNELDQVVEVGHELIGLAQTTSDARPRLAGHMMLGPVHTERGELGEGRSHLDAAAELCRRGHEQLAADLVVQTPRVWIATMSAWNWALLDDADRAERDVHLALEWAAAVDGDVRNYVSTYALWVAALVAMLRRDLVNTRRRCREGLAQASVGGGAELVPFLSAHLGWVRALDGELDGGTGQLLDSALAVPASGTGSWRHVFSTLLADAHLVNGHFVDALAYADDGLAQLATSSGRWLEAELHRLRAEALAGLDPADPAVTEALHRAIEIASHQGSLLLQRRAETSASRLVHH